MKRTTSTPRGQGDGRPTAVRAPRGSLSEPVQFQEHVLARVARTVLGGRVKK